MSETDFKNSKATIWKPYQIVNDFPQEAQFKEIPKQIGIRFT